ncbi:hypothetical protein F4806DRAFT_457223 [Annulohypoxylon nitens]|nr:hypothetical protein F4806DRAFT_457223 [Annulohypoxylon nitens]
MLKSPRPVNPVPTGGNWIFRYLHCLLLVIVLPMRSGYRLGISRVPYLPTWNMYSCISMDGRINMDNISCCIPSRYRSSTRISTLQAFI